MADRAAPKSRPRRHASRVVPLGHAGGSTRSAKSQGKFDSTERDAAWEPPAPGNVRQFAVVRDLTPS